MKFFTVCLLLLSVGATGTAQYKQTVGIIGTSLAGASFDLVIDGSISLGPQRVIPIGPLSTDYSALALTELLIRAVNMDYRDHDNSGWEARNSARADGSERYDSTFEIFGSFAIDSVGVAPTGGTSSPVPRSPGISFNPTIINHTANIPSPYVAPWPGDMDAELSFNDVNPANDLRHRVEVPIDPLVGGSATFKFTSGPHPGAGIMLLAGVFKPGNINLGNGTIDLGTVGLPSPQGVAVVVDGIFQLSGNPLDQFFVTNNASPATHTFSVAIPPSIGPLPQSTTGYQALMFHPAYGGTGYRVTQAVVPILGHGRRDQLAVSTDGFVVVPFLSFGGAVTSFDFYNASGVTQAVVHENGGVSFGTQQPLNGGNDPNGTNVGEPFIFANHADWDLGAYGSPPNIAIEQFADEVRFQWGSVANPINQIGGNGQHAFECVIKVAPGGVQTPHVGTVFFSYPLFTGNLTNTVADSVVGITGGGTPSGPLDPNLISRDLGNDQFSNVVIPGVSIPTTAFLEQENQAGNANSNLPPQGGGGIPVFNDGYNWHGKTVGFFPPLGSGEGAGSNFSHQYHTVASDLNRDIVLGSAPASGNWSLTGGNQQVVTLVGYFRFLFRRALFDPVPGTTAPKFYLNPPGLPSTNQNMPVNIPMPLAAIMVDTDPNNGQPPPFYFAPGSNIPVISPDPGFKSFEGIKVFLPDPNQFGNLPPGINLTVRVDFGSNLANSIHDLVGAVVITP